MGKSTLATASFEIVGREGACIRGEVRVIEDGRAKPVLLLGHGFRGHRLWSFWPDIARRFAEKGFFAVTFDFTRIYAEEERLGDRKIAEISTLGQEITDWETLVDRLLVNGIGLEREADLGRVAVLGHSRAGTSAVLFAAEHQEIRAVVVWNGGAVPQAPTAADGAKLTLREEAIRNDLEVNGLRYHVSERLTELEVPTLFVQGGADNDRLLAANNDLQERYPDLSFTAIPGADHTFRAVHPYEGTTRHLDNAFEETVRFLTRVLPD